jgi:FixJ family two-component response regulator
MNMQDAFPPRGPVVAVVDDDPAVRNALKFSLELEGFVVHVYESGAKLLNARDLRACRCLVIDQKMPEMGGIDLIAELRYRDVETPAILITSYPSAALAARAALANIPIVEKPFLNNALLECIRQACAHD